MAATLSTCRFGAAGEAVADGVGVGVEVGVAMACWTNFAPSAARTGFSTCWASAGCERLVECWLQPLMSKGADRSATPAVSAAVFTG